MSGLRVRAVQAGNRGLSTCWSTPEDIADGVAYMVTRPRHTAISELWIMPTDQV